MAVNGKLVESQSKDFFDVHNPATGELIARTPLCTQAEMTEACEGAKEAFKSWKTVAPSQRARVMHKLEGAIRDSTDDLCKVLTMEQGKTLADAAGDVFRGLEVVEMACALPSMLQGETLPGIANGVDTHSYRLPLGVCAGITPFNFPAMCPLWMFPYAVTCGNSFLLKPSERVPLTAMEIWKLAKDCGLPDGVMNVIHGTHDAVNFLCDAPDIKSISFVGGNAAGEHIYRRCAETGKRAQCNMGAKNHAVVLPDADPGTVIGALSGASVGAAGQRCMATSVAVFVGKAKDMIPGLVEASATLKVGPGTDAATAIGPLISKTAQTRVETLIQTGVDQGAELCLDGRKPSVAAEYKDGYWVGPTIFRGASTEMNIYKTEIFGPVLTCIEVDTFDEAIALSNRNQYGNGCAIFTESGANARKYISEIEAGQVGVNLPIPVPLPMFSFTGNKKSIQGDLNFYGKAGMQFYTHWKTVTSNWKQTDSTAKIQAQVTMPTMK
jgi:malonate-semialdehyde dehydrogenase (acetylating)/methylmalonate-semialdehyde dehydrogenase